MVKTKDLSSSSRNENDQVKFKGVRKRKWGKYVSEIRLPNSRERIWLGSYQTAETAAKAFDAALFCLRGGHAKFNFPHDPPNIAGGQSLTPAEIQVVAQQYANNNSHRPPITELEDESPSSNSEGAGTMDSIDWSFLDMLDSNDHAGNVSDFGLFPEPGDMYIPPNFPYHDEDINDDDHGNDDIGGHFSSSLWNF